MPLVSLEIAFEHCDSHVEHFYSQLESWTIDVKTEKCHNTGLVSLIQKLRSAPPNKQTIQPRDAFEDTAFKLWFKLSNSTSLVVEYHLLTHYETDKTNRFLKLCVSSEVLFPAFSSTIDPLFYCWKAHWSLKRNSWTQENNHLHIYSLWLKLGLRLSKELTLDLWCELLHWLTLKEVMV